MEDSAGQDLRDQIRALSSRQKQGLRYTILNARDANQQIRYLVREMVGYCDDGLEYIFKSELEVRL